MKPIPLLLSGLALIIVASGAGDKGISYDLTPIHYNMSEPDTIYELPYALHEISGITKISDNIIACIQDENGIIYFYNIENGKADKMSYFARNGDYEGITSAENSLWVLRSDGVLFDVTGYRSEIADYKNFRLEVPARNIEGLCFDKANNRLLIGPKDHFTGKEESRKKRFIYAFDLKTKMTSPLPVFTFNMKTVKKFAEENHIDIPYKHKKNDKKEPDIEFRISEIAINPVTDKLFVLSGMEQLLMVFSLNGEIEYMEKLDDDIYKQPEGLTFLDNGDMLISNESRNKKPTIVRCNFRKEAVK